LSLSIQSSETLVFDQKEPVLSAEINKLLGALGAKKVVGDTRLKIRAIQYDSRLVQPGDLFVAIRGFRQDGHQFIPQAIARGASAILAEKDGDFQPDLKVLVEDSRLALAGLASEYYDHPSSKLSVIGVTGTNGKTTLTYWLKSILDSAGAKTGLIGTVKYFIGRDEFTASRTTPESLDLQAFLQQMVCAGIDTVVMEVSSHALELRRVYGIDFHVAVFTNLTREHLDFHKTMENYRQAKGVLFNSLGTDKYAILNLDDPTSLYYASLTKSEKLFYSLKDKKAQFFAKSFKFGPAGTEVVYITPSGEENYKLKLTGEFNLSNFGGALAAAQTLGLSYDQIKKGAESFSGAPGRMEKIDLGQDFNIWIDYAHTPDGMQRVLETVRSFTSGRLFCLFGCGGDRDQGKRPQMGKVAESWADLIILSSDNPRGENPDEIISDILEGINQRSKVKVILDRKEALEYTVSSAKAGDTLLVTGKGHENYQEVRGVKYSFNEREIIEKQLQKLGYSKK